MHEGFKELNEWAKATLAAIQPAQREQLIRRMIFLLRKQNSTRMKLNVDPDGQSWQERKQKKQGRNQRMMPRLSQISKLKTQTSPDGGQIHFGKHGIVAAIHHYGLLAEVYKGSKIMAQYPARALLGISDDDEQDLMNNLLEHFSV